MHSYYLLILLGYSTNLIGLLRPLDFDKVAYNSPVGYLLKTATQLFHDIDNSNLFDYQVLDGIIARQVDLIGGIYVLKSHQKIIRYLPEDLLYLSDLIERIKADFNLLEKDYHSEQVKFINGLFVQIEGVLAPLL